MDKLKEQLYEFLDMIRYYLDEAKPYLRKICFGLLLVCCFPVGLYFLWFRRNRMPIVFRALVTLCMAAVVVGAVTIAMPDDPYRRGSVEFVSVTPNAEVYGPGVPDSGYSISEYMSAYSADSVILLPTASPEPIYVYCNDNGKYYHTESCRYVKEKTPRVTLTQALVGGFTPCKECKPPIQ